MSSAALRAIPVAAPLQPVQRRLELKRAELMGRLYRIRRDRQHAGEPLAADSAERAVQRENDDVLDELEAVVAGELQQIREALDRLAAGKYGVCETCQRMIDPPRLRIRPYAVRCERCGEAGEEPDLVAG